METTRNRGKKRETVEIKYTRRSLPTTLEKVSVIALIAGLSSCKAYLPFATIAVLSFRGTSLEVHKALISAAAGAPFCWNAKPFWCLHFSSSSCSGAFASSSPLSSKSSCQALARSSSRCWALLLLPPFSFFSFFSSFSFLSFFSSFPGFSPFPFFSVLSPFSFFPPFPVFLFPPFSVFFGFGSSSADASGSSGCGFFGFSGIRLSRPLFFLGSSWPWLQASWNLQLQASSKANSWPWS